jgi:ABC-type antimicrobial peptide transport system permease subunit
MALVSNFQPGAILVRTRPGVPPLSLSRPVQSVLLAGNSLPVAKVRTMEQAASDSIARQNFDRLLLELFAAIALLLAAIGIYGVVSYGVTQRTQEIGIRAALGAGRRDLVRLVLTQASRLALAGAAAGLAAAFALTRLLRAELFGVTPRDPLTFVTVPLILLAVALAAAAIPACRAARVDPMAAMRID